MTDHLAAKRRLYHRPTPVMPDVLMIDIPAALVSDSLPLGRFYPIILEAAQELNEMEAFLHASRSSLVRPDLFDRRPSAIESRCVLIARYTPPAPGWPWLLLCRWPSAYTAMLPAGDDLFA
ncbi:MAG: hypothetical protein KGH96_22515 [Sphingomonadales bacterium]|nr:hypothetical protein [Sphingomonadales bacterium]